MGAGSSASAKYVVNEIKATSREGLAIACADLSTQEKEKLLEVLPQAADSAGRPKAEVGHESWSGRVRVPEVYLDRGTAIADTAKRAITVTQVEAFGHQISESLLVLVHTTKIEDHVSISETSPETCLCHEKGLRALESLASMFHSCSSSATQRPRRR